MAGGCMALSFFAETCAAGFYATDPVPASPLNFMHHNICGRCETQFCAACEKTQGVVCEECKEGYYMQIIASKRSCLKCEFEKDRCTACSNETTCTHCVDGYIVRPVISEKGMEMQCIECPTADGCATCANSSCTLCLPGYYLDNGDCRSCALAQTGCDGCSNATTCEVCSEFGYKLDETTKKCVCDTDEGFVEILNPDNTLKLCECAPQSYMVNETAPKKGAPVAYHYPQHKKCFKCSDMFNICAACTASNDIMPGTREFT